MKENSFKLARIIQLVHVPLYVLIGALFSRSFQNTHGLDLPLYMFTSTIGHFTTLSFALLVFTGPVSIATSNRQLTWIAGSLNVCVISLLFLDLMIYSLYRFHINGFVLEMIFGGAATDIFRFSSVDIAKVSLILGGFILTECAIIWYSLRLNRNGLRILRFQKKTFLVGLLFLAYAQIRYAVAHASYQPEIASVSRTLPFYPTFTANKLLLRLGLIDFKKLHQVLATNQKIDSKVDLAIPRNKLELAPVSSNSPNILWIVVDSLRGDTLNPTHMPKTWEFSEKSSRYEYHRSGSNGTRGGIFTLFYGFPSLYWESAIMMFGAPWISVLQDNNYELGIFASSPLYSPEFDKTVFLNVSNLRFETTREGKKANTGWISDVWAVEDWLGFLDHRESSKPFFGFLFFDAVHAKDHPPGQQPFLPASKQATFVGLNNDSDPTEYRNLYNNSAHFVDGLVGQVLEDLQKRRLLENTVVVFTADHGEEFNDNKQNYWGHNGNFSDAQIQVPLSIYWPGKPGKAFSHPTTHYDVVPTLLKNIFGMKNPASDISFGSFLDDEGGRPTWHIAGSPLNFAVIEKDQMMVKFSTGYYETYDKRMKPLPDSAFRPQVVADALGRLRSYYK